MPAQSMFFRWFNGALEVRLADVLRLVNEARDHERRENTYRDVDVEDPRPTVVVDDVTAKGRPERWADHDGHREDRHRHPLLFGWEGLPQDRLLGRLERPGTEALHRTEGDERGEACARSGAAQRGPDDEQDETSEVDVLLTEEATQEGRQRHHEDLRECEARRDPGDLLDGRPNGPAEVRHSDVHDRGVDRAHERPERDRERHDPLVDRLAAQRRLRARDAANGDEIASKPPRLSAPRSVEEHVDRTFCVSTRGNGVPPLEVAHHDAAA